MNRRKPWRKKFWTSESLTLTSAGRPTLAEKHGRDKRDVRRALWHMPLLDVKEMRIMTGLSENQCWKLLTELMAEKRVLRAKLGRSKGKRFRYWLSAQGVLDVADEMGWRIPWQVTEMGIKWLVRRLHMLEAFYALAPRFWAHDGVRGNGWELQHPGPFQYSVKVTPDHKMVEFRWIREGEIHAVVIYEDDVWAALIWVGSMITEHKVREKAALAVEQLQGEYTPAAWAIVGYDRLAARQAADVWPTNRVMAVSEWEGRVERRMTPGSCSRPLREKAEPAKLGSPERVVGWLDKRNKRHDAAMVALNGELNYRVFRFIAEWQGPTPRKLKYVFGELYRAAVREMKEAKLVVKRDGAVYLTRLGMRTVANMDRLSPLDIYERSAIYLDAGGAYRRQQETHNRGVIDVAIALWEKEDDVYGGFRGLCHVDGVTRVSPDAVVCLDRRNGTSFPVYLELEFTADTDSGVGNKLGTYLLLQEHLDELVPLVFVAASEAAEHKVQEQGKKLRMMLTTTWPRLKAGPPQGEVSVWRTADGKEMDIDYLARLKDNLDPGYRNLRWSEGDLP